MSSYFVKEGTTSCPQCGTDLQCGFDPIGRRALPQKGEFSICCHCTSYLVFTSDNFDVRLVTLEEIISMENNTLYELTKARNHMKRFNMAAPPRLNRQSDLIDSLFQSIFERN